MGKKLSIGVSAAAHKGKKAWLGVSNAAHKVKKAWIGDASGKARLFFSSGGNNPLIYIYHNTDSGNEQNIFISDGDDMRTTLTRKELGASTSSLLLYRGAPYIVEERYFLVQPNGGSNYGTYYYSDDGNTWTKKTLSILLSGATYIQSNFEQATYIGEGKFAFGVTDTTSSNYSTPNIGIFDVNSGEVTFIEVLKTGITEPPQRTHHVVKYDDQTYYVFATRGNSSSVTMIMYKWNGTTTFTQLSAQITNMYALYECIHSMIQMGDCILFTLYNCNRYVYSFNMKTCTLTKLADVGNKSTFLVKISDTEFMAIYCYSNRQFRRYTFNGSTMTLVSNYTQTANGYQNTTSHNYVCRDGVLYFVEVDNPGNYYARYYLEYSTDLGQTWTKKTLYDSTKYGILTTSGSKVGLIWNGLESKVNDSTYGMI